MIARGEYRYADFGTVGNTDMRTIFALPVVTPYDLRLKTHTATLGLAYKIGAITRWRLARRRRPPPRWRAPT